MAKSKKEKEKELKAREALAAKKAKEAKEAKAKEVKAKADAQAKVEAAKVKRELKGIEKKRNKLIAEIQPKLMSNAQLKRGGSGIRVRYQREQGFIPVFEEINELGAKLGLRPIGLGHLRK